MLIRLALPLGGIDLVRARCSLLLLFFSIFTCPIYSFAEVLRESRFLMGTLLELTIVVPNQERSAKLSKKDYQSLGRSIIDGVYDRVAEIEARISNYDSKSELSLLNRTGSLLSPSVELRQFLSLAEKFVVKTNGAFDPAVAPLVRLWHQAAKLQRLPTAQQIANAGRCVSKLSVVGSGDGVDGIAYACHGTEVDSGGIGKGYAVDVVVDYLRKRGVSQALINFGRSSSYALGLAPDSRPWQLALRFGDGPVLGTLLLRDVALSVSDSMGQAVEIRGIRYGHIIDPSTGFPMTEPSRAVVVCGNATAAEAYSKYAVLRPTEFSKVKEQLDDLFWEVRTLSDEINRANQLDKCRPGARVCFVKQT